MEYTETELREFIDDAVQDDGRQPRFYAIAGSRMYGYENTDSDTDIIGFHTVNPEEYSYLDNPKGEVQINMDGTTQGFEKREDIELRSYELKKFSTLLLKANFTVIEPVFCGDTVMNGVPLEMEGLSAIIRNHIPLNIPHTYVGMAKSNYYSNLDRNKPDSYKPWPKKFLHVYRGLLAAQHVLEDERIVSDISKLASSVSESDEQLVNELIEHRKNSDKDIIEGELEERAHKEITNLFNSIEPPSHPDKSGFKEDIDDWMRKVRN